MQKCSQEGPREGFGTHFKWIWEVLLCIVDLSFFCLVLALLFIWDMYGMCMAYLLDIDENCISIVFYVSFVWSDWGD